LGIIARSPSHAQPTLEFQLRLCAFFVDPYQAEEPATSAARIAASRRSTCSPLRVHPWGFVEIEFHIAQLWADVRLCPRLNWVVRDRVMPATGRAMSVSATPRQGTQAPKREPRNHAYELSHREWTGTDLPDGKISDSPVNFQRPNDGTASAQKIGEQNFLGGGNSNYGAMFANKITVDCP
jgi:hypothetical protein